MSGTHDGTDPSDKPWKKERDMHKREWNSSNKCQNYKPAEEPEITLESLAVRVERIEDAIYDLFPPDADLPKLLGFAAEVPGLLRRVEKLEG